MKNIGIMICSKVKTICTMGGCFKAASSLKGAFEEYSEPPVVTSVIMCSHCEEQKNDFKDLIARTKKSGAQRVHFGVCTKGCPEGHLGELIGIFENEGIEVILGTH